MKTWKVYVALIALSFVVGLGLVATYAPSATAGDAPAPYQTCDHSCMATYCYGPGSCPVGYVPYNRCGKAPFCWEGGELCDCTFIGCGFPC